MLDPHPLFIWGAVAAVGLAYAVNEELRYRRERRKHLADRTRVAVGANRIRREAVAIPPGHASMVRDVITNPKIVITPKRIAYYVPAKPSINGKWWLVATDGNRKMDTGRCFSRRSTALRACRQANAREAIKHRKG